MPHPILLIALIIGLTMSPTRAISAELPVAIVAHRGASFDAPENTLAAFCLAWQQNADAIEGDFRLRSEEHTSELQSRLHLVCRLLLEKKKTTNTPPNS